MKKIIFAALCFLSFSLTAAAYNLCAELLGYCKKRSLGLSGRLRPL